MRWRFLTQVSVWHFSVHLVFKPERCLIKSPMQNIVWSTTRMVFCCWAFYMPMLKDEDFWEKHDGSENICRLMSLLSQFFQVSFLPNSQWCFLFCKLSAFSWWAMICWVYKAVTMCHILFHWGSLESFKWWWQLLPNPRNNMGTSTKVIILRSNNAPLFF